MTQEVFIKILPIIERIDGGCSGCIGFFCKELVDVFPETKPWLHEVLLKAKDYPMRDVYQDLFE